MKKESDLLLRGIFLMLMSLLWAVPLQAQTIQNGSHWFDGAVFYSAQVSGNQITMTGKEDGVGDRRFRLIKQAGTNGEYVLSGSEGEASAIRGSVGWQMKLSQEEGVTFLALRNGVGNIVWTCYLTSSLQSDCVAQQYWSKEQSYFDLMKIFLMNNDFLSVLEESDLCDMMNAIEQSHSDGTPLGGIEKVNYELLTSELLFRRKGFEEHQDFADEPVGDVKTIEVDNALDFISALGSGHVVVVKENTTLNLSEVLEDKEIFERYGRAYIGSYESEKLIGNQSIVASESVFDGRQLCVVNMRNLVIRGKSGAHIEVNPRYSFVLNFVGCSDVVVENLTIGHTEGGYCEGGVVGVSYCDNLRVNDCDLYGCGTYGFCIDNSSDVKVVNSNIHDCTYGIMQVSNTERVAFERCDFYGNREFSLVECSSNKDMRFTDSRFFANHPTSQLFSLNHPVFMDGCVVCHPEETRGDVEQLQTVGTPTKWIEDAYAPGMDARGCGPH